jgi:outer membrane immunogenic protein
VPPKKSEASAFSDNPTLTLTVHVWPHQFVNSMGTQMHKFFLRLALISTAFIPAASALAADLEIIPPPPPPPVEELRPATYDWTGITAGIFVSANAVEGEYDSQPTCGCLISDISMSGIGFAAGARFGADYQMGDIVFGAIADWSLGGEIASNNAATEQTYLNMKHMGTLRGRLGWALDDTLIYATGGVAMAEMEFGGMVNGVDSSEVKWSKGLAMGAGVEHALSDVFSVGVEYMYVNFAKTEHFLTDGGAPAVSGTASMDYQDFHTVRATANYRFSL